METKYQRKGKTITTLEQIERLQAEKAELVEALRNLYAATPIAKQSDGAIWDAIQGARAILAKLSGGAAP